MKRLFIGLRFNEGLNEVLQPWIKKMRKTADKKEIYLKWTHPENFHITLVFLGNTPDDQLESLKEKVREVAQRHSVFELKVHGADAFPEIESGRVVYLGVQRSQALLDLQSDCEQNFLPSQKHDLEYRPHLTLARLRNPKSCKDFLSPFQNINLGRQQVAKITLYESVQTGSFSIYKPLFEAAIGVHNEALDPA